MPGPWINTKYIIRVTMRARYNARRRHISKREPGFADDVFQENCRPQRKLTRPRFPVQIIYLSARQNNMRKMKNCPGRRPPKRSYFNRL